MTPTVPNLDFVPTPATPTSDPATDDDIPDTLRCPFVVPDEPVPSTRPETPELPSSVEAPAGPTVPRPPPSGARARRGHDDRDPRRAERREKLHRLVVAAQGGERRAASALEARFAARLLDAIRRKEDKARPRDVPDSADRDLGDFFIALGRGELKGEAPAKMGLAFVWLAKHARRFARHARYSNLSGRRYEAESSFPQGDAEERKDDDRSCRSFDDDRRWWP